MKSFIFKFILIFYTLSTIQLSADEQDFSNVLIDGKTSININGALLQIGNQTQCRNSFDGDTCLEPTVGQSNNVYNQYKVKIDTNASSPYNSMARLVFQDGDEIEYARLYWSGRLDQEPDNAEKLSAKTVQIKGPASSTYTTKVSDDADFYWLDYTGANNDFNYVASIEVTDYITANRDGEYYVGDVDARNGSNTYGSWQLVVVVKNDARSLKNIALFQGFKVLSSGDSVEVPATGFITPVNDEISFEANLFIYTGESDANYDDTFSVCDKADCSSDFTSLVDGLNDSNDVANGSAWSVDYGYRDTNSSLADPNFRNVLGLDIDKLPINIKDGAQILQNAQTETELKLTSSGDTYSLNMFAFETEVYVPSFCYDYAYSQQGKNFTEENDGTQAPTLSGDVVVNEPIEMTIYLKSLVDNNLSIENMVIDVADINRTQATYIDPSTKLATSGEFIPSAISPTFATVGDMDYLSDIDIGNLNNNDYFYLYYSLDPQMSTMDMPIKVNASYDLVLDSATVPYILTLSEEIPLCTSNSFDYTPAKGVFNIVHTNYYTNTSTDPANPNGTEYYNLPTQVVNREGNFKVISMNPENLDQLQGVSTVVAVEMIDAAAFHTTDASCSEYDSSITPRVWVVFENNVTSAAFDKTAIQAAIDEARTTLTTTSDFYKTATQNTAFRVSYNVAQDSNISAATNIYVDKQSDGSLTMNNWQSAYYGESCAADMGGASNKIADNCRATGNNAQTLSHCMECVYGIRTKFVCSRDNFSIRPEAFSIKINDQDQTNTSSKVRIADDISAVTTPATYQVDLAAGYRYNLEINATTHINSNAADGYTKTFDPSFTDSVWYTWQPTGTPTGCNDESNSSIDMRFVNGVVNINSSLDQVGEYNLSIVDTTWTSVDSTLHTSSDFDTSKADCLVGDSTTQATNSSTLNGCNISSNHNATGSALKYRDYSLVFHPYKFNMTGVIASFGENNSTTFVTKPFIYMSDISVDNNMSFHLNGDIKPVGYNNIGLSNFVADCYAKPVSLDINKTHNTTPIASTFVYNFHNYDVNNSDTTGYPSVVDINESAIQINVAANDFTKDLNGLISTSLNLNFDRNQTIAANPESVTYNSYTTKCQTSSDCTMFADLTTQETKEANATIGQPFTMMHYYGRTNAPRKRYNGSDGNNSIYYEVYCDGCNKINLQNSTNSTYINDPRWFINTNHTTNYGFVGNVTQKYTSKVTATLPTNNAPAQTSLQYTGSVYPYKATMQNSPDDWLIYNKYNPNATSNEFEVEFEQSGSSWSGKSDTNSTSITNGAAKTNRRIMW